MKKHSMTIDIQPIERDIFLNCAELAVSVFKETMVKAKEDLIETGQAVLAHDNGKRYRVLISVVEMAG